MRIPHLSGMSISSYKRNKAFLADLLNRESHCKKPVKLEDVANRVFRFQGKPNVRIFQFDPVRVYLVHDIDEKWLFWGRIFIQSQSITKKLGFDGAWKEDDWDTSGTYKIIDIYEPEYQKTFTMREAPQDKNYFHK